jgi:hypothetical protein
MASEYPSRPASPEINPYAPPTTAIGDEPLEVIPEGDLAAAEAMRRQYLGHEASVRSIGSLYLLGAILGFLGAFFIFIGALTTIPRGDAAASGVMFGLAVGYLLASSLNLALGIGLRRLKTWARWTAVVLISLSLLWVLLGIGFVMVINQPGVAIVYAIAALIPGYILYLLISSKGSVVFSPEYRAVINQTPHIKYKTSLLVKVLLGLFVALIVLAIVGALISANR